MENSVSFEKQYKNIVRKFFFRQNPPKPLTKEEFIAENQLEGKSNKEIENRYYSYIYVYNYQYVQALDQKVDREIGEANLEDENLAEIEQFLSEGNHFESKDKRKKKKHIKKEKKHSFSIKEWLMNKTKESNPSHLGLLIVCGLITLACVGFGTYEFGRALGHLIFSGIGTALKTFAISGISFMLGSIFWTAQSIVRTKDDEEFSDQDMMESEVEFSDFFQPKKRLKNSKEKEKEEITSSDTLENSKNISENDTLNTIPMGNSVNYKMNRTTPSATPVFNKKTNRTKKEKNSLVVNAKAFFNKIVNELKLDDPFEDEEFDMYETPEEKPKMMVR
ncbi:MAG: hypothetical protein K2I72_03955 [Bacilli bacterium]|nr:hypothetical protein [Bacilli bacterium]